MSTSQQTDPLIGRLVDSRYRVRARIARGGMATVYVATDLRLERRVALKVMHGHLSDDTVFQSRFIQEARAAARLADPHVVNVFDQGQDGDMAYLVMEYLPGITLRELLKEQKRLSLPQTITIMDAVLAGLSAAHRASIVHRDVKPENVLLAEDGRIKIGDFGLARATTAATASGQMLLGTIAYLAPELLTRGMADARSDIYSLGIMLYELLTGEQPYKGEQPMQVAYQHATDSVPRPSARNPEVPEQLDELVLWATEREPDDRPTDAREMLDRLREIERQLGIFPQVVRSSPAPMITPEPDDVYVSGEMTKVLPGTFTAPVVTSEADHATRLRRRSAAQAKKGVWLLLLVLLLTAGAGATGWWFGSGPGSQVVIPDLAGESYESAQQILAEHDLAATDDAEYSVDVAEGLVTRTDPAAGDRLDREETVRVFLSLGPQLHDVESLSGRSFDEATEYLAGLDIAVDADATTQYFTDATEGTVVAASAVDRGSEEVITCIDGCAIHQGATVTLGVSLGSLPDVVGDNVDDARGALEEVDLTVNVVETFMSDTDEGVVHSIRDRDPSGWWRPGDEVTLDVSLGSLPDVIEVDYDTASQRLEDAGLDVERAEAYSDDVTEGDVIALQDREGGGNWRPGDTATLTVSLGPEPVVIPDVQGMTIREAAKTLRDLHFEVSTSLPETILWDVFRVSSTTPEIGTAHPRGTSITIVSVG